MSASSTFFKHAFSTTYCVALWFYSFPDHTVFQPVLSRVGSPCAGERWLCLSNCTRWMKASPEECARQHSDLEGEQSYLMMVVRKDFAQKGWTFKSGGGLEKGIVGQRKAPRMVQLGCRKLEEGGKGKDEIRGVGQPRCRGLCVTSVALFHELPSHSTEFDSNMQESTTYSDPCLLESSSLLFQRSLPNKPVKE